MTNTVSEKRSQDLICTMGACKTAGTYTVKGCCYNCDWKGDVTTTRGHEFTMPRRCPKCGCDEVRKS